MTKNYNRQIYSKDAIELAVKAYKDFCAIEIKDSPYDIVCEFSEFRYDETETINEFDNYIIMAMSKENQDAYM